VRASAAIPALPAVEVTSPEAPRPLRRRRDAPERANLPALALGAEGDRVGYEPLGAERAAGRRGRAMAADVAVTYRRPAVDQVGHDVRRMLVINAFFAEHASPAPRARRAPTAREARARALPAQYLLALFAPARRGELGSLSEAVFQGARRAPRAALAAGFAPTATPPAAAPTATP
jgi:hypothetical protein